MVDQYFTPTKIAESCLLNLNKGSANTVADFSIGDGSLIKVLPFKAKNIIGLDLDNKVVKKLKKSFPSWMLHTGNFVEPNESTKRWLQIWKNKVDIILLNPPFSCRNRKVYKVNCNGKVIDCRPALAFVITALQYLKKNGTLVAILPLSTLKSEADSIVFKQLSLNWSVNIGDRFNRNSFKDCTPNSIVITIQRKDNKVISSNPKVFDNNFPTDLEIIRGSTPMHKTLSQGAFKVIHTTNLLRKNLHLQNCAYSNVKKRFVEGTLIFIPRVGFPNKNKIVFANLKQQYVLSDCIIGIRSQTPKETKEIYLLFLKHWDQFKLLYESTCAPYITLGQIIDFLKKYNLGSRIMDSMENSRFKEKKNAA